MKILHVLQFSLPRLMGYCLRSDSILRGQQSHGLDVVAMTGAAEEMGRGEEEWIKGIHYYRTPGKSAAKLRGLREWKLYRRLLSRLREVAAIERPDVIHVHSPAYNALAGLKVADHRRIPCVYEMRAVWEDAAADRREVSPTSLLYKGARALETHILKRADAVVTICQGLHDEVLSRGVPAKKILVTPNAVDTGYFQPTPRDSQLAASLGLTGQGPVFGFIGSFFAFEGVEDLVEAIPPVLARIPRAQFLIAGGGEREANVKERIIQLGLRNSVVLLSRIPHDQVKPHYSVVDCMIYPRRSIRLTELVTPLKPLEAMAMQKAVLASNIGGHREMVDHDRTGLLFEAGNTDALVSAICRAAEDPDKMNRLAKAGREYVLEHRTWRRVTADYLPLYESVLAPRKGSGLSP